MMRWLGLMLVLAFPAGVHAGVYDLNEPCPFAVKPDGTAVELPYLPNFKSLLDDRVNAGNPAMPAKDGTTLTFRGKILERLASLTPKAASLSVDELTGLAVDNILVGQTGTAINLLEPRSRDRSPSMAAILTLAHAHAQQGGWTEAIEYHGYALGDIEPPATLPGCKPEQTKWLLKVEREAYRRWLRVRAQEMKKKPNPADLEIYPLFTDKDGNPVKFVNAAGVYDPGNLAPAERAKLPPDAIAIVQQLSLWSPDDSRLLWLLAELYAVEGRVREADKILEQCTWGRGFTGPQVMMAHRTIIRQRVDQLPPEKSTDLPLGADPVTPPAPPEGSGLPAREEVIIAGVVFAILALGMLILQVRALRRRWSRRPPGLA